MKKKKIYIKPSKRGSFKRSATKAGKSVAQHCKDILKNKKRHSKKMVKKAVFACNARKWNKKKK